MQAFSTEARQNVITNRFRLDPDMSYVSDETTATDPAFWKVNRSGNPGGRVLPTRPLLTLRCEPDTRIRSPPPGSAS